MVEAPALEGDLQLQGAEASAEVLDYKIQRSLNFSCP
jgi:hypothetical protein